MFASAQKAQRVAQSAVCGDIGMDNHQCLADVQRQYRSWRSRKRRWRIEYDDP